MAILSISTMFKLAPFLLSTPVTAVGCFSGGLSQPYNSEAVALIKNACDVLATEYSASGVMSNCQDNENNRINFAVTNTANNGASLSDADCVSQNEITAMGCQGYGGIRAFGDFQLTCDPNSGSC
ncbi:MAG: hypothetical protein MMC33_009587 [Icmadophila ericetorum]|nr:hypothetical protein [Icmadophila ericetorum]